MFDYPFAAIVGQPQLKLALLLAAVDWRLSVLLKGDKGSGKSTAARALAGILPGASPFVNLPIGTTEDRLLGGLNLDDALNHKATLKRGLISAAHNGVLYIDEVNLLADSLTDALLDVASNGRHYIERDGFSASAEAQFVLLGSMNIEEGTLRPQLLDRFALSLHVEAPASPDERADIIECRLRFDSDPSSFCELVEEEQARLRNAIVSARSLKVRTSSDLLRTISSLVTDAGVRSLRADLAILRASAAHAALAGRTENSVGDVEAVLDLVLHHRANKKKPDPPQNNQPKSNAQQTPEPEQIFPVESREAPEIRLQLADPVSRGRTAPVTSAANRLEVLASFTQSFRNTGTASLVREHLVFHTLEEKSGVRFIFVVDSSGSQGAQQRMRAVKGTVAAILNSSVNTNDEVAVISFRGPQAQLVLEPCRDSGAALRTLEFLPTGGRTPLAHALQLASTLTTASSMLIVLTDGKANVPLHTADPWLDALTEARSLTCPAVLVDSGSSPNLHELAEAMNATLIHLDDMDKTTLLLAVHRERN